MKGSLMSQPTPQMSAQPRTPAQMPNRQVPYQPVPLRPERTDRRLWKYLVFGVLTLGIYQIVVMTELANAANRIIRDGRRTMHYCLLFFLVSWITLGIATLVWYHRLSNRIGDELQRRGYANMISASDFWLFDVLAGGVFATPYAYFNLSYDYAAGWWDGLGVLAVIGPCYYLYKLFRAMNALCWDENARRSQQTADAPAYATVPTAPTAPGATGTPGAPSPNGQYPLIACPEG